MPAIQKTSRITLKLITGIGLGRLPPVRCNKVFKWIGQMNCVEVYTNMPIKSTKIVDMAIRRFDLDDH
jgi:hypothetical protein